MPNNTMNKKTKLKNNHFGMTLIEVLLYTVLLSLLITNIINYLYAVHVDSIKLMQKIQYAQNN